MPRRSSKPRKSPAYRGETRMCEIVFPEDTNPYGKMFGGRALQLMDKAAGVAATRWCHQPVVTACSDRVDFSVPIDQGSIIELVARVVYTGRSTIVIRVELYTEGALADERRMCTAGHYTMVAVDKRLRPVRVKPQFVPGTELERSDWERARRVAKRAD